MASSVLALLLLQPVPLETLFPLPAQDLKPGQITVHVLPCDADRAKAISQLMPLLTKEFKETDVHQYTVADFAEQRAADRLYAKVQSLRGNCR